MCDSLVLENSDATMRRIKQTKITFFDQTQNISLFHSRDNRPSRHTRFQQRVCIECISPQRYYSILHILRERDMCNLSNAKNRRDHSNATVATMTNKDGILISVKCVKSPYLNESDSFFNVFFLITVFW